MHEQCERDERSGNGQKPRPSVQRMCSAVPLTFEEDAGVDGHLVLRLHLRRTLQTVWDPLLTVQRFRAVFTARQLVIDSFLSHTTIWGAPANQVLVPGTPP